MEIGLRTFARAAVLCIVGGLMIGYGTAWILTAPIIWSTVGPGTPGQFGLTGRPTSIVHVAHLDQTTGLLVMLIMVATGTAIGLIFRYLPPRVTQMLVEREAEKEDAPLWGR